MFNFVNGTDSMANNATKPLLVLVNIDDARLRRSIRGLVMCKAIDG